MQNRPWKAPAGPPVDLIEAALRLYDQGLPDPRGCEYREITIAVSEPPAAVDEEVRTAGWVLPEDSTGTARFAICRNGLVYRALEVGKHADAAADAKATLEGQVPQWEARGRPWIYPLWAVLLLRSGEPELAADIWDLVPRSIVRAAGRPATETDVAVGRAIFSLEGEGEVRVGPLPGLPLVAMWDAEGAAARLSGFVWQAEEVYRDGRWERFYGFAGDGVHRVPAEEIEFRSPWSRWGALPDGLGARLAVAEADRPTGPVFFPGEQVNASLRIRNQQGTSREVPRAWYRHAEGEGPALPEGFQFRVRYWIPPMPIWNADDLTLLIEAGTFTREEPYSLSPKANPGFMQNGATFPLEAAESIEVARIDLRDWLNLSRPGVYAVALYLAGEEGEEPEAETPELWFAMGTRQE
jgi:hypothetical protein